MGRFHVAAACSLTHAVPYVTCGGRRRDCELLSTTVPFAVSLALDTRSRCVHQIVRRSSRRDWNLHAESRISGSEAVHTPSRWRTSIAGERSCALKPRYIGWTLFASWRCLTLLRSQPRRHDRRRLDVNDPRTVEATGLIRRPPPSADSRRTQALLDDGSPSSTWRTPRPCVHRSSE